jgi:hypothetical protein
VTRVILDLCAGSGAWSAPYQQAGGYVVLRVDLPTDVRLMPVPDVPIHGILAAPPCTMFCRMRMCRGRPTDAQFREALSVVDACLRLVAICRPRWWALENPQGYLSRWLGAPALKFDPWEYGDPWTKRTWLWGEFSKPLPVVAERSARPWIHHKKGTGKGVSGTDANNAVTPLGFARAFMEANP